MSNNNDKGFFGHPSGLATLFATEMWERFSYYGMRALLTLFLTAELINGGFGFDREQAFSIYGIFTGLVYVTPLLGGILADKVLGQRMTIYIGGITMAIGQFMLAWAAVHHGAGDLPATREFWFYCGLGVLILGNGFFKPNISTMVGDLYDNNDPRKDAGFTIFYMGINLGAFISPFIAGYLGEEVSWEYGYITAGVGMLIGVLWMAFRSQRTLGSIGMPPNNEKGKTKLCAKNWGVIVGSILALVFLVIGFFLVWDRISETAQGWIIALIAIFGGLYLLGSIFKGTKGKDQWTRVGVIIVLAFFNIFFWVGFEQAGTTFNLFAAFNTDRVVGGFRIPASWFQSINAIFILVLAPLFTIIWMRLGKRNLNPKSPFKFAWGMALLAAGAAVMAFADSLTNGGTTLVSPLWLTLVYFIFTCGELCISPIGLSMVTKLSPPKLVSTLMGLWMFSFAAGNFGASQMEKLSRNMELSMNKGNLEEVLLDNPELKGIEGVIDEDKIDAIVVHWDEVNHKIATLKDASLTRLNGVLDESIKDIKRDNQVSASEFRAEVASTFDASQITADLIKEEAEDKSSTASEVTSFVNTVSPIFNEWISDNFTKSTGNVTVEDVDALAGDLNKLSVAFYQAAENYKKVSIVKDINAELNKAGKDGNWVETKMSTIKQALSGEWYSSVNVFWFVCIITALASLCLFVLGSWLSKMMKGID